MPFRDLEQKRAYDRMRHYRLRNTINARKRGYRSGMKHGVQQVLDVLTPSLAAMVGLRLRERGATAKLTTIPVLLGVPDSEYRGGPA